MKNIKTAGLVSLLLIAAGLSSAVDKTTTDLVNYFLAVDLADANPKLVEPFLAVKIETLPKPLRRKAEARQIEIRALIRIHDVKKKGSIVRTDSVCSEKDFVLPLSQEGLYRIAGYANLTEDEEKFVEKRTQCSEIDLGCNFSLMIFVDKQKKKQRHLMLHTIDPLWNIVAMSHTDASVGSHLFGTGGITCPR